MSPYENPYAAPSQLPPETDDPKNDDEVLRRLGNTSWIVCASIFLALYGITSLLSHVYYLVVYSQFFRSGMAATTIIQTIRTLISAGLVFFASYHVWQYANLTRSLSQRLISWTQWQRQHQKMWIALSMLMIGMFVLSILTSVLFAIINGLRW